MPISVVTTAYGRAASDALREAVARAKGADALAPVSVIVPTNSVGVAARRRLAASGFGPASPGRGVVAVTFLTVYRLAELLAAPTLAAAGRRPVSTPVVASAVRRALARDPGSFAPVANHPATEEALVAAHRELADLDEQIASTDRALRDASDPTLNSMSVDGDTSTNDTVLLLASGQSGARLGHRSTRNQFSQALSAVCQSLAEQIVTDGEGVQHVIRLYVEQARTREEAVRVARTIAHSALVKTAWAGADPNWGRILAAVGYSGVPVDPSRVNIAIGGQTVCRKGTAARFDEKRAHQSLAEPECDIRVQLGRGASKVRFLTTDLTAEYVRINADYST